MSGIEEIERTGLNDLSNRWNTMSIIGDNVFSCSYATDMSVLVPLDSVEVGDIVSHANISGVVETVTLGNVGVDLGLSSIVVKYADPYNYKPGINDYYKRVVFVFGKSAIDLGDYEYPVSRQDQSHAVYADVSSLRILKRSTDTYKNHIEKLLLYQEDSNR
jgi:hypothetical protein